MADVRDVVQEVHDLLGGWYDHKTQKWNEGFDTKLDKIGEALENELPDIASKLDSGFSEIKERLDRILEGLNDLIRLGSEVGTKRGKSREASPFLVLVVTISAVVMVRHRAIGAKHAAITLFRSQPCSAAPALVKELAGVGRHRLRTNAAAGREQERVGFLG